MPLSDQVLTAAQMRAAEAALIAQGVSVDELMQRAGRSAAEWVWRMAAGRSVAVLCGPGNNGGDGYVIAEALRERGLAVTVVAPVEPATDAARNAHAEWRGRTQSEATTGLGGVLVDCLFGSGLSRALSPEHEALIAALASRHAHAIAIDLPSGVATDDGALLGAVPQFDLTLALGAWKPAHFLMPAMDRTGTVKLVDIGIAPVDGAASIFPRPCFAPPSRTDHKYTRGLVGVVAGAMPGASVLAAKAAMRGGAGYVKLLSDDTRPRNVPAALVVDGRSLPEALADERWSAMLVGPGLGRDEAALERLGEVLEAGLPIVLDADALRLIDDDLVEGVDASRVLLTPHEGELSRLCSSFGVTATGKLDRVKGLAALTGFTVLAKGADTVLAAADGRTAFFPPAPTWLASAGTGDVLAGLAASRLGTGADPFQAAGEAVWLHREAALIAGSMLIADDLVDALSVAYARFL